VRLRETHDVAYKAAGGARHTLDVYALDEDGSGGAEPLRPVVVFVHGGGWKWFSKRSRLLGIHQNVPRAFARRGFVAVAPNYRLSRFSPRFAAGLGAVIGAVLVAIVAASLPLQPVARYAGSLVAAFLAPVVVAVALLSRPCAREPTTHPAHARDVADAVAWTVRNASKYGGDAERVILVGHSAGGHLIACLLTMPQLLLDAGVTDASSRIAAAISFSGVFDAHLLEHGSTASGGACASVAALFRRQWFLVPAFGRDRAAWAAAFPTHHTRTAESVRALRLPPLLLVNAQSDAGLERHSQLWAGQLRAGGATVDEFVVPRADHLSYLLGIDRPGWQGEDVVMPVVDAFLQRTLRRKTAAAAATRGDAVESVVAGATTGAGAMPSAAAGAR